MVNTVLSILSQMRKNIKNENDLDNKLTPSRQADIIKHIEVMKAEENCGKYKLLKIT